MNKKSFCLFIHPSSLIPHPCSGPSLNIKERVHYEKSLLLWRSYAYYCVLAALLRFVSERAAAFGDKTTATNGHQPAAAFGQTRSNTTGNTGAACGDADRSDTVAGARAASTAA